jgi:membrane peptidoglycan carboxypeptidase
MELNLPDLSRVSRVYADSGEVLAELHDGRNSEPISYDKVPEVMVHAILAAEDSKFFDHEGVDFSAIVSAAIDNFITQQVVKNAFVGNEISIRRKVNEAFVSAELERRFPKERILEYYMNSVYFGSGAYGVKTAAEEFYDKRLNSLEIDEAATLAVLVRNPSLYNPRTAPERTLNRRNDVITEMAEQGWITDSEAERAIDQPLGVVDTPPTRGQADHVVAEVRRQLLNSDEFSFLGDSNEERKRAIFGCPADDVVCEGGGGLQIFTTIDLKLQKEANRVLGEWLPLPPYEDNLAACAEIFDDFEENEAYYRTYAETHSCRPTGAIAMVDNETGAVKVMASGLDFEFSQFDLAVQGRRNPGSAFKAVGLAAALEQGFTLGHRWSGASPLEVECEFICSPNGTNVWTVHNASRSSTGVITLEEATYRSVNTVYAQVSRDTGPENIVDMARRMGITEASLEPVLSIVLGASAVSPMEMASAFSNFATNGAHADDYIVAKIVNHEGEVIYQKEPEVTQVADPALFAAARRPLTKVPTGSGTAPRAEIGRAQGGKTGTHQSYLDAWYVGFTPEYSTAVWVGYEAEQIPLENVVINGQPYDRVFGGSVPAPIWAEFMTFVMDGLPETDFPAEPANIEEYLAPPPTTVPSVVGLSKGAAVQELRVDAKLNVSAVDIPSLEPAGIVVRQSIAAGSTVPQGTTVTISVSNGETPVGVLPDFTGMTPEEAEEAADEFTAETNVALNLVTEEVPVQNEDKVGLIVGTNPPPGAEITASATIVLQVGIPAPKGGGGGGGGDDSGGDG